MSGIAISPLRGHIPCLATATLARRWSAHDVLTGDDVTAPHALEGGAPGHLVLDSGDHGREPILLAADVLTLTTSGGWCAW